MTTETGGLALEAIRARGDAATEGPWCADPGDDEAVDWFVHSGQEPDFLIVVRVCGEADAEFIAAARTDVPALLAEVERLTAGAADEDAPEAVEPTPAQAWRMLLALPAEKRLERLASLMERAAEGQACWNSNHAQRVEEQQADLHARSEAYRLCHEQHVALEAQRQSVLDLCDEADRNAMPMPSDARDMPAVTTPSLRAALGASS